MTNETTMKDCVKIHLPNGKVHKMVMSKETDKIDDDVITNLRELMGKAENINVSVEVDVSEANKGMKSRSLILWGETFKNSYITVERY